ncbi:unnamed protein product [Rotaria socialis]|uniref:Uncharacterized protein n=1 Tax=Rotaria socialis TaxID=392032 RepID=A0A818TW37_9BILA|nr:unnamed protein product [Rotaria socialis]CAF4534943.1 unnamed protein product [Rotaria socialis]
MINWRQLYNESQLIRPEDSSVSTERINRLVNIYKNDMIDQDLHQYVQRLSTVTRCCQTCAPNSYMIYKWLDTYISGNIDLFDFHLSGRSVSALVYYWNKNLLKQYDERGQLSDFKQNEDDAFSISLLSNIDENIIIRKHMLTALIPNFINKLLTRFQMYYTHRKAQSFSSSIQVHAQPMKSLQFLSQTNISSIFICFIQEDNNLNQLFWIFRHLITKFNWPLTTKIFSNRSFQTCSIFERTMANYLGFIDISTLNMSQTDLLCYLYRCLKTCHKNGPMIFLFDYSTIFKPTCSDYYLISFLCDLIRFDLSIPKLMFIPTRLHNSYLSFSQPFLFNELFDCFIKKINIQKPFCEATTIEQQKRIHKFISCIFLHLAYDTNQLVSTSIEFQHIIALIELSQIPIHVSPTIENIFNTLQTILQTCPFIIADNHKWNEITQQHIEQYHSNFADANSKSKLVSLIRKEYFLDILAALSILSKVQNSENMPRIFECELLNQMTFLLFTFGNKHHLNIRSCQTCNQIIQQLIQHCQLRNYISTTCAPQKSMHFRDTILSDHEWSDDNDDAIDDAFADHDDDNSDDEIILNNISNKSSEPMKPSYRINYKEYHFQLKFFAKLVGSYIEAIVTILKYHIDKQLKFFTLEQFNFNQTFYFSETVSFISNDILSFIRRAYAYQSIENINKAEEVLIVFDPIDDDIYPLLKDNLVPLHNEFVKLLNCCCI